MTRIVLSLVSLILFAACGGRGSADVTLYVALDEAHSRAMIARFEEQSGVSVNARYDTEASKTVGLVTALIEEANRPRCDVFWNNEVANTVMLGQKGMLEPYASPNATGIPDQFKAKDGSWTGFAARARILIVNTELVPEGERPTGMWDLCDPKWKGKCAIARPVTGTTLTHFVALRVAMGQEKFDEWVDKMRANDVAFLQSNGATMKNVADTSKGIAFAFTDTDDYHVALGKGHPVTCVFPDQGEGQIGTMLIPNSVAIIKDGPNPEAARKLVDFVVSEELEGLLAAAKSAQIPVRASVTGPPEATILGIGEFRPMQWDAEAVAKQLPELMREFDQRF